MATKIALSRYFNAIEDLSLTLEQEIILDEYALMVKRICRNFISRTRNNQGDDPLVSADDLVQLAMVRLTVAIKHGKAGNSKNESGYYYRLVTRLCLTQVQHNKVRGDRGKHKSIDDPDNKSCLIDHKVDFNRLHDTLYTKQLLNAVKDDYNKQILIHYYGLETAPLDPQYISDILPLKSDAIYQRIYRTIRSLRNKVNRGELPS